MTRHNLFSALALAVALTVGTGCDQHVDEPDDEIKSVDVVYDGQTTTVDLGDLTAVDFAGDTEYVRLTDVVDAADLGVATTSLEFDFVAGDGFMPLNSPNCTEEHIPTSAEALAQGYIHQRTRRIEWEDALGFPGCMRVSDVAEIRAADAASAGAVVTVALGSTEVDVALSTLDAQTIEGEDYARLSDVVEAADLDVVVDDLFFDFVAGDGFRPGDSENCVDAVPLSGSALTDGYIHLTSRDLHWDDSLGLPGCMGVDDVARIEIVDAPVEGETVTVSYGETEVTVDLADVTPVTLEGEDYARLSDVVALAELGTATDALEFDFEASDGFRPSMSTNCTDVTPVAGTALTDGYIHLTTRDLHWDDSLGLPGCMGTDDVVLIVATDPS